MHRRGTFDYEWHRLGLRFEELSGHLARLDIEPMRHVRNYHLSVASLLRRRIKEVERLQRIEREAQRKVRELDERPFDDNHPWDRRRKRQALRRKRNMELMRLARRGWSNDQIARKLKLHPTTVSKIIQHELKLTRV